MKARLLNDEQMVNPLYLQTPAADRGGIQQTLPIPAGTVIDNVDAWMLCMLGKAVPADEECKARVDKALGNPRRLEMLERVRRLRAADGVKQLDPKSKKWLEYMEATYAKELGVTQQAASAE